MFNGKSRGNVCCSTAVSNAYGGRRTWCMTTVNSAAGGRRTTDISF
ncbi:MAG: hypothetical protein HXL33_06600 [Prevotellaceae bacterium]|nr:hypothetical protein [Prevotellaceae bacterium]